MHQLYAGNSSLQKEQLICPIPHRMTVGPQAPRQMHKSPPKNESCSMAGNEGEVSYEILDIFFSKSRYEDQPYFCGSPPSRSDNPLVHDAQFIRKGVPTSPVIVSPKSSCGSSFGAKPLVRVEGFASSSPESHCRVSALA